MRTFLATALLSASLSTSLFAATNEFNPDTARAYEGYLVTFLWPEGQTKEHIDYKNIYAIENLLRLDTQPIDQIAKENHVGESNSEDSSPLANVEQKLARRVTMLSHQKWTLIFKHSGDTLEKSFYSEQQKDGYPELTGNIKITLGRYLESDIHYQHYLFDSFSQPAPAESVSSSDALFNDDTPILSPSFKAYEPGLVLNLHQSNKTASKKINYLDHPTIGTLLYFEPLELEVAMERMASKAVVPETGNSLTYDDLNSTNELN